MKIFLFLAIFAIFFISCDNEGTTYENKCNPNCSDWKICTENRTCQLKDNMCDNVDDCKDNTDGKTECNDDHECSEPAVVACTAGEKRCNLNNVETCNTTGDAWEVTTECTNDTVCEETSFTCETPIVVTCTSGDKRCNLENIEICNANGNAWELDTDCVADNKECKEDTDSFVCEAKVAPECVGLSFDNIEEGIKVNYYEDFIPGDNLVLSIQFYENTAIGNYDLASTVNSNFETCEQCVLVYGYDNAFENLEKLYFQSSGNIEVTKGEGFSGESAGEVTNIKLIEVTIDENTHVSTPVDNGSCFEIETGKTWIWDTMPRCELDALRCSEDTSKIEKCTESATNTWTETEICDGNKECKVIADTPSCELKAGSCDIGTKRCNENNIEVCDTDGMTWNIDEYCTLPNICIENTGVFTCESNIKTILEIKTEQVGLAENEEGPVYTTNGIVVAVTEHGFYMQDDLEAGIFVFLGYSETPTEMIGDNLQVTGTVKNYGGLLEIVNTSLITISGVVAAPDFTDIDAVNILDLDAQESMLVKLSNPPFTVLSVDENHNVILKDSNANEFKVRNSLYMDFLDPMIGREFIKLQGVLTYEYEEYKLLPRMAADIEEKPEVEACTTDGNECDTNLVNTLCYLDTLTCVKPIEVEVCTDAGDECLNNTNNKTTCINAICTEVPTKTLLEIRTLEADLGTNATGGLYKTSGIVTAIKSNGFYLQDGIEAAIFVYTGEAVTLVAGDKIQIMADVKNYNSLLELVNPVITNNGTEVLPMPVDVDALNILNLESQESMLVNFLNSPFVVLSIDNNNNITLNDSNDNQFTMKSSIYIFNNPAINTVYSKLQGILSYEYGEYRLLPISDLDMVERAEVTACTELGNECMVNVVNTVCNLDTLNCMQAIEVDSCAVNLDCVDNTNGKTVCFNDSCVIPIEITDCTNVGDECLNNTNGKTACELSVCVYPTEVVDCPNGDECSVNQVNTVCNASSICEPAPTLPLDGDFEVWEADALTQWNGSKTNISITPTKSTDFHTGMFSVTLVNENGGHERFTTKASTWAAGDYTCTYYAKGTGEIRVGRYNGSSYLYGDYTTLAAADWTQITETFTLNSETTDFEFILSLRKTDASGLTIDSLICTVN